MSLGNRDLLGSDSILLESFYYVQDWQLPIIKNCKFFLLDSGAFTFLNNSKTNVNWKEYIDKYIEFINKNDIEHFFELDVDSVLGYENVKKIRHYIEERTQKKCIPVWHKSRGIKEWFNLCDEYDYVAIGGIVTREIKPSEYKNFTVMINEAHKRGCKVHGLGFTNLKGLKHYKFDSVDSTSWLSAQRFGSLYLFEKGTLRQIKKPAGTRVVSGENLPIAQRFVLCEWIKFQKYAEKHL
jgi:hypothetical protein